MSDEFGSRDYLDTRTGEIVNIPDEVMSVVESEDEEEIERLPDWEQGLIETAKSVFSDEEGRYVDIPRRPSYEGYNLMVEFANTVKSRGLREKLDIALDGKGAFRRFKNVLKNHPDEEKRWFAFKDERMRQDVRDWLHSIGIEPVEEAPSKQRNI
jgi:hypothetical protein